MERTTTHDPEARGERAEQPEARRTPALAPDAALASAIGNHAFTSMVVLAREPAAPYAAPAPAAGPAAAPEAERDLTPEDLAVLEGAVIPSLRVAENTIGPTRDKVALTLRYLEPAIAALDTLTPRSGSEAQEAIRDAKRRLRDARTRLKTLLDGKRLESAAGPWMQARNEALLAFTQAKRRGESGERVAELIEGTVLPSIDVALERLMHPGADYEQIYEDSIATSKTIRSVGVSMIEASRSFHRGQEALRAIIDEEPKTLEWAEAMFNVAAGWLGMIVESEKAPPEGGAPKPGPPGEGRARIPAPPPGPAEPPAPLPPGNPWRKPLGPPYP